MYVQLAINATYEISIVEAVIDGNVTQLNPVEGSNTFDGTISLSSIPQGIHILQINVTDVLDNTTSENRTFFLIQNLR
ncbi:hypothetical protein PHEL85_0513 [Polaribacter sp. Hel1_85]|nr:hypothetical protein PHEL85_0513 [Polaribacter sp. Hel1_85]